MSHLVKKSLKCLLQVAFPLLMLLAIPHAHAAPSSGEVAPEKQPLFDSTPSCLSYRAPLIPSADTRTKTSISEDLSTYLATLGHPASSAYRGIRRSTDAQRGGSQQDVQGDGSQKCCCLVM